VGRTHRREDAVRARMAAVTMVIDTTIATSR
jgi:hypothetical protein